MKLWQSPNGKWKFKTIDIYAGYRSSIGRIGAIFYGLVWNKFPIIAIFTDNAWYEPAFSCGLALGPIEIGFFFTIRVLK